MKKTNFKLVLTAATTAVVMLSGVTAVNAGDLKLAAQQPSVVSELNSDTDGMYIVRLTDAPVATYEGGVRGLAATSARANGQNRLNTKSKAARNYEKFLKKQQKNLLGNAGKAFGRQLETKFDFQHAVNGFAVELTVEEAKAMRNMDGVVSVDRERMEHLTTDAGPAWIGAPSIWNNKPSSTQGEGVVIAVLDSGINFDHPSFADIGGDGYDHTNPLGSGNYVPGSYCDTVDPTFCNDKLIGAWTFTGEVDSPNDSDGHGSHTASTAAGNVVYDAELAAPTTEAYFNISGVAPHANIIAYDVCIDSCPGAALVAAINQVVIDAGNLPNGIAALNYSISGGGNPYNDTVELGFLNAVAAGVYVSASAGNSGPGASTVAHLGPWVSTTAASTHNRAISNSLIDMDGSGGPLADISGSSFSAGYGPAPMIHANTTAFDPAGQCLDPFPPGTFSGEIVVCDRGTIARVDKGANVLAGGAGGFVLANLPANGEGTVADPHFLPAIHIGATDGDVLRAWLSANTDTVATITDFGFDLDPSNGDVMAGFSSRGPQLAFDVNKPDVTAPGVDIMGAEADGQAAVSPEYQFLSGTSMSSPHNAGAGALMASLHPDWTPQEIKSALMMSSTTANTVKENGVTPTDPFDLGAGRIDLDAAKQAGLVMNETQANFLAADPDLGGDPSTLNLASMMDSVCVGTCSWTRTVTNPDKSTSHWNVTATGDGFDAVAEVSPEAKSDDYNLKLKKGESGTITVTADTTLSSEGWHFGTVNLDRNLDKGPDLHMPIVVYSTNASNPEVFTKTVDAATAAPGDTLTYELTVTNGQMAGPITVTDMVPAGTTFVPSSETESVVGGSTSSPWAESGGTLSWTGMLDQSSLLLSASPSPFGYFSLGAFGVAPFGCPSNCDDGAIVLNVPGFTYNGQAYSQVIWSVNGTLEAGSASGVGTSFANQNLPSPIPPNNILAPNWTDLNMGADGDGAEWYVAVLSAGPDQYTVYEWDNIPLFGDLGNRYSFQIWVQSGASGNIWFTYAQVGDTGGSTVGVENNDGTIGDSYWFEGTGTPPAVGTDLKVDSIAGGSATLGFQAVTDCSVDPTVNTGEVENDGNSETAIAVTTCQ